VLRNFTDRNFTGDGGPDVSTNQQGVNIRTILGREEPTARNG
jgi:hypothetical protein